MNSVVSLSTALALNIDGPNASTATMTAAAAIATRDCGVQRSTAAALVALMTGLRRERGPDAPAEVAEEQPREQDGEKREWPAMRKPCGFTCAPRLWATPSTMPPTSVPQSDPAPPITVASKAKMSCAAPA